VKKIQTLAVLVCLAFAGQLAADDQAPPTSVGTGRSGQTAWEFVGTIQQNGVDMTMSGYVTALAGLAETQLFTDPTVRSDATARCKFSATAKMTTRNVVSPLFVLNANATGKISCAANSGFAGPTVVASFDTKYQTIVDVTAAGKGRFEATGETVRTDAQNFTLDGVTYRLGEANRLLRIQMTGDATLTDPSGPISTIVVAGRAVIGDYLPQP